MKNTKSVIVTGASGFIGRHLVPALLKRKYQVYVTSSNQRKLKKFSWHKSVKVISLDINNKKTWNLKKLNSQNLIHLAWQNLPNYEEKFHLDHNLKSNYNFIKKLLVHNIKNIVVTGTCFEYGKKSGIIYSNCKPSPMNNYAKAKNLLRIKLEKITKDKKINLKWARLFYMYGEGQNKKSLLPQLDKSIRLKKKVFNMGSEKLARDYLPVKKVVDQLITLLEMKTNGKFNICSGKPTKLKDLVENYIRKNKSTIKVNSGAHKIAKYESIKFWGYKDIVDDIYLPVIPNAPLIKKNNLKSLAPIRLRYNKKLKFLENDAFDANLIKYDSNYDNSQSYSNKFKTHMQNVYKIIDKHLKFGNKIVEVGCGQGHFINQILKEKKYKITGYDTTYKGRSKFIKKRYLNKKDKISTDMIILRHVLEHVKEPYTFLKMLKKIFGNSKIYIEVPEYNWILSNNAFFDITYEHVNYFTQFGLSSLFKKKFENGLVFDNQYQYIIANIKDLNDNFQKSYNSNMWKYLEFNELFPNLEKKLDKFSKISKNNNIYVWGAGTKGCMFLNHGKKNGIFFKKVKNAIDINPNKIGKFLDGSGVKIISKKMFFDKVRSNDLLLIANPAYKREIKKEILKNKIKNLKIYTL